MPADNRSETRVLTRTASVGDWKYRGFFRSHCGQFLSMDPANLAATARTLEKGAISTKETAGPLARQLRCVLCASWTERSRRATTLGTFITTILGATDFSDAANEAVKYRRATAVVRVSRSEARASE